MCRWGSELTHYVLCIEFNVYDGRNRESELIYIVSLRAISAICMMCVWKRLGTVWEDSNVLTIKRAVKSESGWDDCEMKIGAGDWCFLYVTCAAAINKKTSLNIPDFRLYK